MTHRHAGDLEADVAPYFPQGLPGRGQRTEHHHASARILGHVVTNMGWRLAYPDLGEWGRPDFVAYPPDDRPWVVEYKSYRPGHGTPIRTCILQTFGYVAALDIDTVGAAYLVLGGDGQLPALRLPPPLDIVQVVTPAEFLQAVVERFCEDLPPDPDVSRDAPPTPTHGET